MNRGTCRINRRARWRDRLGVDYLPLIDGLRPRTLNLGDVLATWSIAVPTRIGFHGPAWGRT